MMNAVITLTLGDADKLRERVIEDSELRDYLHTAMWHAENGDICNDVFLFDYTASYELILLENSIDFVKNG